MTEDTAEEIVYTPDQARVAKFLFDLGIGGGDDPIGFLIASHQYMAQQRNEAQKQTEAARSTLSHFFDLSKQTDEQLEPVFMNAVQGYLRTSRSGGMPKKQSDLVETTMRDFCRLYLGQTVLPVLRSIISSHTVLTEEIVKKAYQHFMHDADYPCSPSAMREAIEVVLNDIKK
jgi:hypothetical protein